MSSKEGPNFSIGIVFLIVAGIVIAIIHVMMDGAIEILSLKGVEFPILLAVIIIVIKSSGEKE
jgi:hypothetical protein